MTKQIELERIDRGTNIREEQDGEIIELAESIKQNGLLNPITVKRKAGGRFEVVAGHRRFLAMKILQEPWVECNVLEYEPNERELLCIQLQENVCRKNMSAWEFADLFKKLMKQGMNGKQIARLCGKSEAWVSQQLMAERTLEKYGDLNEESKKMTVAEVRNRYGSIASGKKQKHVQKMAVIVSHCARNVYTVRVNNTEAEKELVEFLEQFKAKYTQKEL